MESKPEGGRAIDVAMFRQGKGISSGRYIGVLKFKHKYSFGVRYIVRVRTFETLLAYVYRITRKQNMPQSVFNPV